MIANTSSAVSRFVSFLDNDGRVALASALYDSATQHFTWMSEYQAHEPATAEVAETCQQAIEYHRAHWRDLGDAADYVSRLVIFEPITPV
jgi:hypothetical protein